MVIMMLLYNERSVVYSIFIVCCCSYCLWVVTSRSLFCFAVLCLVSSFAIISLEKREREIAGWFYFVVFLM